MCVNSPKILLILLSLLQLVAPLVHAHSSNDFARFGLHLPTFEVYSAATAQNIPVLQVADNFANLDDAIVSISSGIRNQQNSADDLSPLLYFPPTSVIFSVVLASCEINFSPQTTLIFKTLHHTPQSPRAPPHFLF